jgi:DNA-binding transcriptional LysR family regulator
MKYSLHQLEVFLAVCRHQSITRAAEQLDLTQPAVSIQLKNFQDQFRFPLTETVAKQIYVTDFGHEVEEMATCILSEVEKLNAKALGNRNLLSGTLKISIVSTGKYVMPYFLSSFLRQYSGVELKMNVTNRTQVLTDLSDNVIDFALVSLPPSKIPVNEIPLLPNKLFLVGNDQLRLDTSEKSKEIFKRWPLILREPGSGTRTTMERFLERNRIIPGRKIELTSNEAVKQAVLAGIGFSIMPLIGIKNELADKSLHIVPYRGLPITTTWRFVWRKQKTHSEISKRLLEHIAGNRKAILKEHFSWQTKF